jgi:tripartite-type tricarboxylate transporter receptor subunit TctC
MTLLVRRRDVLRGAASVFAASLLPMSSARAQLGKTTTRLVVGFPPGGSGDLFARIIAQPLGEELDRNVIVDNKPGAGGMTAAQGFVRYTPDGSALLLATGSAAVTAPISHKTQPYDPVADFAWISHLSIAPFVIAVTPAAPVKTLVELIAYAKSKPGTLSYGSAGIGTTVHLAGELLKEKTGIDAQHVPYRGSGPAIIDTLSGERTYIIETFGTLLQYHKAGTLRIVAVMAQKRSKIADDIPTVIESGVDALAGTYNLLAAPPKTSREILEPMVGASNRVMARPAIQELLLASDIQPITDSNPDKAREFIASEVARWKPVVDRLGLAL